MIIAFVISILLGVVFPLVGAPSVYKRLSSSGDALAHSSLAGVAIGLVAGFSPLWASIVSCVLAFLLINLLRRKFGKYAEIGVVVVLSAGVAISGILSGYASAANFDSYLFGSILLVSRTELYVVIALAATVILFSVFLYRPLMHGLYSESEAKLSGIRFGYIDLGHSLLFSLSVAIGAKVVGSLVVTSMLVLPVATALLLKKGYFFSMMASLLFSLGAMIGGFFLSNALDWKPGATCVGLAVAILLLVLLGRGCFVLFLRMKKRRGASPSLSE